MSDLWVEWKWGRAKLSPRQLAWLNDRYAEGRKVAVVCGTSEGAVIFTDKLWSVGYSKDADLAAQLFTRKAVAAWIEGVTCAGRELSWRPQQ
jgi:putative intracellular protease/amidase